MVVSLMHPPWKSGRRANRVGGHAPSRVGFDALVENLRLQSLDFPCGSGAALPIQGVWMFLMIHGFF
jgi:hypothetical protein